MIIQQSPFAVHVTIGVFLLLSWVPAFPQQTEEQIRTELTLRTIDDSRIGRAMPDSSAVADIDRDREPEVFSSMRNDGGHPEVFLYDLDGEGNWNRTRIGVVEGHREEIEWVDVGRPFPGDNRFCVAVSVQHRKNGLVVFYPRKQGLSPYDPDTWKQDVANEFAGQGLRFEDLDGDHDEELLYATQAGNELGVIDRVSSSKTNEPWRDHVIDTGNDRAWWWLDGKFYDLNRNGSHNDFFVSTRTYGGSDTGIWAVVQDEPNDLSSYRVQKIYDGNALQIDTGYFFSRNRNRRPDVVMVNKPDRHVYLLDGRNDYDVTRIPIDGSGWNVKILPSLGPNHARDSFVVATAKSPSLFWSFRWRDGAYEVRRETARVGNYAHPMDGTFTVADVDRDGVVECITPDSSSDERANGLGYLDLVPATDDYLQRKPEKRIRPGR